MTEQEARAALKAEMPWATTINVSAPIGTWIGAEAEAEVSRGGVSVLAYAPTLRAAVAKAIKAWRATQPKQAATPIKRTPLTRFAAVNLAQTPQKKGAKR